MDDNITTLERVTGTPSIGGDSFTYVCPVCKKKFRYSQSFEPVCTGPSENSDEHPPVVMRLYKVDKKEVNPLIGKVRADSPLILPPGFVAN